MWTAGTAGMGAHGGQPRLSHEPQLTRSRAAADRRGGHWREGSTRVEPLCDKRQRRQRAGKTRQGRRRGGKITRRVCEGRERVWETRTREREGERGADPPAGESHRGGGEAPHTQRERDSGKPNMGGKGAHSGKRVPSEPSLGCQPPVPTTQDVSRTTRNIHCMPPTSSHAVSGKSSEKSEESSA